MNIGNIKGKGSELLQAMGGVILVSGIIGGLVLLFQSDGSGYTEALGLALCIGSVWLCAVAINIANINTNLERLCYYKKNETERPIMQKYNISITPDGYYLVNGAKHRTLGGAIKHAKNELENKKE